MWQWKESGDVGLVGLCARAVNLRVRRGEAVRLPYVADGYANCIHDVVSGGKVMDVKKNSLLALALGGVLCCGALQAEVSQALPERGESPRAICESPRSADGGCFLGWFILQGSQSR